MSEFPVLGPIVAPCQLTSHTHNNNQRRKGYRDHAATWHEPPHCL